MDKHQTVFRDENTAVFECEQELMNAIDRSIGVVEAEYLIDAIDRCFQTEENFRVFYEIKIELYLLLKVDQ